MEASIQKPTNVSWITPADVLLYRLDAEFYGQEYVEHERLVLSKHGIPELGVRPLGGCGRLFAGPFGSKLPSHLYRDRGVPLFRVQNVYPIFPDETNLVFLDEATHKQLKTSEVVRGDLLLSKAGRLGDAAMLPARFRRGNVTEHVMGFKPNDELDPYFLLAALNSPFVSKQFERFGIGTLINYLGIAETRSVEVPAPSPIIQRAIGNYIRKAERLRETAETLKTEADELLRISLRWKQAIANSKAFGAWVGVNELKHRLDATYNSAVRLSVTRHLARIGVGVIPLSELAEISAMIGWKGLTTEHYVDSGPYLIRGVDFENGILEFAKLVRVDRRKYDEQPQIHLRPGDVMITKDGTIGKALTVPATDHPMCAGSTVARLRPTSEIRPEFLEAMLNHVCVQAQIESFATGLAQPHITQEWIAELLIPRLDCENEIAQKTQDHHSALYSARELIQKAMSAVESLVSGSVDEAALLAESGLVEKWLKSNSSRYTSE